MIEREVEHEEEEKTDNLHTCMYNREVKMNAFVSTLIIQIR